MSWRSPSAALSLALLIVACHAPQRPPRTAPNPAVEAPSTVPPVPVAVQPTAAPPSVSKPALRPMVSMTPPPINREFRGVWVASVANIDWPSSRNLSTFAQQRELLVLLDRAVQLHLNAVILQVRPAADALYASSIEPWSEYLTGTQGKPPDPFWDPLSFAVREAHARNLELHAWFNPYRARNTDAKSPLAKNHIARTNPSLIKKYAGFLWMDPGERAVRERTVKVVLDVVNRYDIDAVHLDDYFYPYPENDKRGHAVAFNDDRSWTRYRKSKGVLSRADWRRENVDKLVQELDVGIHRVKPWVRFGISPFGIWRPGFPAQIRGFDSYANLYADARKWLREGWVDYFTPQLYWPTTKVEQAYPVLLGWWAGENILHRHLWPGNFTSRAGGPGASAFSVSELAEQIRVTRAGGDATGNVHFSMKPFLVNQASMNDTLIAGPYAESAIIPASPWLTVAPPSPPTARLAQIDGQRQVLLTTSAKLRPWQWLIRARTDTAWITVVLAGTVDRWSVPAGIDPSMISVSSLNRVGSASAAVIASSTSSKPAR